MMTDPFDMDPADLNTSLREVIEIELQVAQDPKSYRISKDSHCRIPEEFVRTFGDGRTDYIRVDIATGSVEIINPSV